MSRRCLTVVLAAVVALAPVSLAEAQSDTPWSVPRTADGRPDLQGVWDFRTLTPLQRPTDRADQAVLSEEEAAEIEDTAVQRAAEADLPSEIRTEPLPAGQNVGGYNNFWFDRGAGVVGDRRTSLIIDPPDGRVPRLRHDARHQIGSLSADLPSDRPIRYRAGGAAVDGPEDRGLAERCLLGFNSGPPMALSTWPPAGRVTARPATADTGFHPTSSATRCGYIIASRSASETWRTCWPAGVSTSPMRPSGSGVGGSVLSMRADYGADVAGSETPGISTRCSSRSRVASSTCGAPWMRPVTSSTSSCNRDEIGTPRCDSFASC